MSWQFFVFVWIGIKTFLSVSKILNWLVLLSLNYCTTYKLKCNTVCLNLIFIRSEDQRVDDQVCKCEQACGSAGSSVGSGLCRAERHRFETQPTLNILSVPIILNCIVCSNKLVGSLIIIFLCVGISHRGMRRIRQERLATCK